MDKNKRLTIRLDNKTFKALEEMAKKNGVEKNKFIIDLINKKQTKDSMKDIDSRLENIEGILKIVMLAENKSRKSLKVLLFSVPKIFRFLLRTHFNMMALVELLYENKTEKIKKINQYSKDTTMKTELKLTELMKESFRISDEEILEDGIEYWRNHEK